MARSKQADLIKYKGFIIKPGEGGVSVEDADPEGTYSTSAGDVNQAKKKIDEHLAKSKPKKEPKEKPAEDKAAAVELKSIIADIMDLGDDEMEAPPMDGPPMDAAPPLDDLAPPMDAAPPMMPPPPMPPMMDGGGGTPKEVSVETDLGKVKVDEESISVTTDDGTVIKVKNIEEAMPEMPMEEGLPMEARRASTRNHLAYFIAEQVHQEFGKSITARVKRAYEVKPKFKDLTPYIWGDRNAGDSSDKDLIRMTEGEWNYIYNDVVLRSPGKTGASAQEIPPEVVRRLLAQRLYEAGVRGKGRIEMIAKLATERVLKGDNYYRVGDTV